MEDEVAQMSVSITGANPFPGNIKGGLTTIEEKSLGCIYKAENSVVREVVEYAQKPNEKGLIIMDTPEDDMESITGMIAGGAQICVFTTGFGTPTGSPIAPLIKICGNPVNYNKLKEFIDINAGTIIEGSETTQQVGDKIIEEIIEVFNGKQTKCEKLGIEEFAINRVGPTM